MKYAFLWILLLWLGQPLLAQQRQPPYWEASPDSLKRVLARQRTDTARLRTVQHLLRVDFNDFYEGLTLLTQATALTRQLHHPAYPAYRTQEAGEHLRTIADSARDLALRYEASRQPVLAKRYRARQMTYDRLALDSLKAAIVQYDALGYQEPYALSSVQTVLLGELRQWQELQAYFAEKLMYYEQQQKPMSMEYCYLMLAVCAIHKSDYNQAISYLLQDAELLKVVKPAEYHVRLRAVGGFYADWGNYDKAQQYLQQALALTIPRSRVGTFLALSEVQKQQGNYQAALANVVQALRTPSQYYTKGPALELRAEMLVRLHQLPAAKQALAQLQQFSDSVSRVPGTGNLQYPGYESRALYHMARKEWAQAEAAWLAAHEQPDNSAAENIHFLRELASFYTQRNQPRQALTYSLRAAAASDTLQAKQNRYNVAYYEQQALERRQASRITSLRQTQVQAEVRARRQRLWLLAALGGLILLGGGATLLWRLNRQKQQANALLATQKAHIEAQAVRLGELDEAKNQFFANVSHELRTPLTLVLGPLDTLLTDPAQTLPAAARAPVALAHRQAQRLLQLVNRILDLTKLQAGRLALHPAPTPLGALLRRVVGQFESLATQRGIALLGPAALPDELHLLLDAGKVEEILTNLLINALNHTPPGGTVRVTATLPGPEVQYAVTVHDTGPGIAAAEQERIFERFYQSPQVQAQGGTGLGLALGRELALLLGGSLTLVSEAGQGAAFTLRFPAPALPAPALENSLAPEPTAAVA
ncbi:MAG: HAMP domain-containing histidine kinase, partial [Hymenobacter sp.]